MVRRHLPGEPDRIGLGTADDGRFFDVNNRLLELLGRERQEVLGRTWTELEVGLEHADGDDVVDAAPENRRLRRWGVRFRTKSGEVRQGLLSVQQIRLDGMSARLSLLDDLTARGAPRTSGTGCSRASAGRGPRPRPPWAS